MDIELIVSPALSEVHQLLAGAVLLLRPIQVARHGGVHGRRLLTELGVRQG